MKLSIIYPLPCCPVWSFRRSGTIVRLPLALMFAPGIFGVEQFLHEIDTLIARDDLDARMVFLDCDDEVLQRRFTETRRRQSIGC